MAVHVERRGPVTVLTIDRPRVRNALDPASMAALTAALTAAADDPAVRVVVLTGVGDRAFSAGLDLAAVAGGGLPDESIRPVRLLRGGYPLPVLAAINGPAVGGGFELALACDLRVAAEHAFFALPEVSRGIAATEGGTELPRQVPLAVALEIGLTADRISARRAYELGLVNRVVPGPEVLPTTVALAERIAAPSPAAVRATKALMRRCLHVDQSALEREAEEVTAALLAGPDAAEGAAAFVEKRPPRWADPPPFTAAGV